MAEEVGATKEEIREIARRDVRDFFDSIIRADDLVPLFLKCHLHVEYWLERLISAQLPAGYRVVDDANLTFAQKLALVHGFDVLDSSTIGSLRQLNRLRNSCAHLRDATVTTADIEKLGMPFGKEFAEVRRKYGDDPAALALNAIGLILVNLLAAVYWQELPKKPTERTDG